MTLLQELRDEMLPLLAGGRAALEKARASGEVEDVVPIRELLHKIAGTAAPVGLPQLSRTARFGEELLLLVLNGDAKPSLATLALIGRVLDAVGSELAAGDPIPPHFSPQAAAEPPSFPAAPRPSRPTPLPGQSPQVLMVDGDAVSVKLFTRVLSDHGFEVRSVTCVDAPAQLEDGFGDAMLLDVSKAGASEPTRALVALAKSKRMPLVMLSKVAREHPSVAAVAKEADDYLTKPVAPEAMVAKVRTLAERRRAVRAARARAATVLTPAAKKPTVLVVDDSRVIRGLVRQFLGQSGIDVVEADDGGAALKVLEGMGANPAAVVVDMQMPVIDGLGLTRELRSREALSGLPIVMLSAQDDSQTQAAAIAAGANAFLVKQKFDAPELRKALRAAGMSIAEPT